MFVEHSTHPLRTARRRIIVPVILAAVLALALGIRLHYALACTAVPSRSDMAHYSKVALESGIPTDLPPGYPLFLRLIFTIWGIRNYTAVYVAQSILSAFTVLLVFMVTRAVSNARAGLFAAGIAAIYPSFIAFNLTTMTESISLLIVLLLYAAITIPRDERARPVLAALALAAGYLFKPALLLFAPGVLMSVKRRLLFLVSLAVIVGPIVTYDFVSGTSALRGARGFYRTYNPATHNTQVAMDRTQLKKSDLPIRTYVDAGLEFVRHHKMKTLDIVYSKASIAISRGSDRLVLGPVTGGRRNVMMLLVYSYLPVMILGFVGVARAMNPRTRRIALPALSFLFFVILFSIFKIRYRLVMEPAVIMFAGIALDRATGMHFPRPRASWLSRLVAPPEPDAPRQGEEKAIEPGGSVPRWKRLVPARIRRDWDIISIILLAAIALRLVFAVTTEEPINAQEAAKIDQLVAKGTLGPTVAPLYPLFLRATYAGFGAAAHRAVFIAQALLVCAAIILLYVAITAVAGRKAGIVAASLAAVLPNTLIMHLELSPAAALFFCAVALMAVAASTLAASGKAALSGLLAGIGVLLAPVFAFLVPGVLVTQRRWRLFLLVLAAALLPYILFNASRHRALEPVYSPSLYEIKVPGYSDGGSASSGISRIYRNAAQALSRRWGARQHTSAEAKTSINSFAAGYAFVLVLWLGLVGLTRCWRKEHRAVFFPPLLFMLLIIVLSKFEMRHRVVLLPVLFSYAAMLVTRSCRERTQ
jgi:4-amino-4-deoxy-L-arabinose transferase-like glycosyltransferase